jgi:hypothetical protein
VTTLADFSFQEVGCWRDTRGFRHGSGRPGRRSGTTCRGHVAVLCSTPPRPGVSTSSRSAVRPGCPSFFCYPGGDIEALTPCGTYYHPLASPAKVPRSTTPAPPRRGTRNHRLPSDSRTTPRPCRRLEDMPFLLVPPVAALRFQGLSRRGPPST